MISTIRGEVLPTAQATAAFTWQELVCKWVVILRMYKKMH